MGKFTAAFEKVKHYFHIEAAEKSGKEQSAAGSPEAITKKIKNLGAQAETAAETTQEDLDAKLAQVSSPEAKQKIAGLKEEAAATTDGYSGRISKLIEHLMGQMQESSSAETPSSKLARAAEQLREQAARLKEIGLRPRAGIVADAAHIENQEIDIIAAPDENSVHIQFKLTQQQYESLCERYNQGGVERSRISYGNRDDSFDLADCWQKNIGGMTMRVSAGTKVGQGTMRSSLGLVEIVLPDSGVEKLDQNAIADLINKILASELQVPNALETPDAKAEREYKQARYKWHHKAQEVPEPVEKRLSREEVFPGYFTMVENGKHQEYGEKSPYAVFHRIYNIGNLPVIIKAGGLLSTHERYRRGMIVNGMSSCDDMRTGGADSVFTRIVTREGLKSSYGENSGIDGVTLVFEPDLLDRTDWYAYDRDIYGSTEPDKFDDRLSPAELFKNLNSHDYPGNEQMFRTGIPLGKIKAIACRDEQEVSDIIKRLRDGGIDNLNGKPLEEVVILAPHRVDLIDISQGTPDKNRDPAVTG